MNPVIDPATIPTPLHTGVICRTVAELAHVMHCLPATLPIETLCGNAVAIQFIEQPPGPPQSNDWPAHVCFDDADYLDGPYPFALDVLPPTTE